MKISTNKEHLSKLLQIINDQPDAYVTALFKLPDDVLPLLISEFWPRAIYEGSIVNDEETRQRRANAIVQTFVNLDKNKKFLDYGCGDSGCAEAASYICKFSIGYDIGIIKNATATREWVDVIKHAPYDVILLYDTLDHIKIEELDDALLSIKSVSDENTVIRVKCHPWTSAHGGHLYYKHNKAFAHLFLESEEIYLNRSIKTINDYDDIFTKHGFTIKDKRIHNTDWDLDGCLEFFDQPDMIRHFNNIGIKVSKSCKDSLLNIAFVDYELKVNDPNPPFVL